MAVLEQDCPAHWVPTIVGPVVGGPDWWFATEVEILFEDTEYFVPTWRVVPITVRPDWMCEILSKNHRNDLIKKKRVCHRDRVGHYWIIDPAEETLVHRWHADGSVEVVIADRTERVRAEPSDGIELCVGVLFGDDPDE